MIEYRFTRAAKPSVDQGKMNGRAIVYNSPAQIGGDKWGFRETVAPGAARKSVKEGDIVLLDSHDPAKPIARMSAGTLRMKDTKDGLDWDADPADTTVGRDAAETARNGNYGGCSFGFEVIKDSWKRGENGALDERTLEEVRVHEISACVFPAYGDTSVSARDSYAAARESRERQLGPIETSDADKGDKGEERADNKPYGNVTYADPKNGKYPIDTKAHAKAAWAYISVAANAAKYPMNGVSLAAVKAKIKAACKKFGVQVSETDSLDFDAAELRAVALLLSVEVISDEERDMLMAALREDADTDPYADEFYERADAPVNDSKTDSQDAQDKGSDDSKGKSDASDGDKGKAKNNCNTCKGSGKDKSGNKCAACGGSGQKNGDGKNHDSGPGQEDPDGKKPSEQKNSSDDTEHREGEPGSPTRTDGERRDALRRMRARQVREQMAQEAADREGQK